MNLCIPVDEDRGLKSPVCGHFGSAPFFLVVNTEGDSLKCIPNGNADHRLGMCQPMASLRGEQIDGVIVAGIGRGALGHLQSAGIKVFFAREATAEQVVSAFKAGSLAEVSPEAACQHHGGGHRHGQGSEAGGCCGHHREEQ